MNTRKTLYAVLTGLTLFALSHLAGAQEEVVELEAMTATPYLNGGIGKEEADAMRRVARDFPLRITFAEGTDNEFTTGVPVLIADAKGDPVFALPAAGPLLYVDLPAGRYTVSALDHGVSKSERVSLDHKRGKDVVFSWKEARDM